MGKIWKENKSIEMRQQVDNVGMLILEIRVEASLSSSAHVNSKTTEREKFIAELSYYCRK